MRRFIPFLEWLPSAPEYADGALEEAVNLIPIFGGYRTIAQSTEASSVVDGPPTGAHAHYYQQTIQAQKLRPDSDVSNAGLWVDPDDGDLYALIDEESPGDGDFILSPGDASSAQVVFGLSDGAAPGATTDHHMRWRYFTENTPGAWEVKLELLEGASTVIATDTASGTGDASVAEREKTLSGAEAGAISDHADLSYRFTATVAGDPQELSPTADGSGTGTWTTDSGGTTNIYQAIDESTRSDADYIRSPILSSGGGSFKKTFTLGKLIDPYTDSGFSLEYAPRGTNSGTRIITRLKQGTTVISSKTVSSLPTSFGLQTINVSAAEAAAIDYSKDLEVEVEASYPSSVASTAFQSAYPVADVDIGLGHFSKDGWDSTTFPTYWDSLIAGTSDFTLPGGTGDPLDFAVGMDSLENPAATIESNLRVKAGESGAGGAALSLSLRESGTPLETYGITVSGLAATDYDNPISSSVVSSISNWSSLEIAFGGVDSSADGLRVYEVELEIPEPRRVELSYVKLIAPSVQRAGVTWAELEIPDPASTFVGDQVTLYCGTNSKLYEVSTSGFSDVSKAGGYATGTVNPVSWDFATWGEDILATNKVDPIQSLGSGGTLFADLITSTDKPKSRFISTIRNHVLIGDINLAGHFSDEVWWSAVDDSTTFESNITTLSDYQRLLQTPGQIMGLVGGETAVIFKRNSIYRMDFVGGNQIFDFNVISGAIGTPFPKSIVRVGDDIYFRGSDEFYVIREGYPVPVGYQVVSKFLKDTSFSPGAISAANLSDPRLEDQAFFGAYDRHAGVVLWIYGHADDVDDYRHHRGVVYNPRDDRWGVFDTLGADISLLIDNPNITMDATTMLRGMYGFSWDGTNTAWVSFSGAGTYAARLKTKIFSLSEPGYKVIVRALRPVWHVDTQLSSWPDLSIQLESCDHPDFLENIRTSGAALGSSANSHGFIPIPTVTGEFHKLTVDIPSATSSVVKEFLGVHLDFEIKGEAP